MIRAIQSIYTIPRILREYQIALYLNRYKLFRVYPGFLVGNNWRHFWRRKKQEGI